MKILIVGDFHSNLHEKPLYDAFLELDHDVYKFSWWQYFKGYPYGLESEKSFFKNFYYKFQNKFLIGPAICKINKDLLVKVKEIKPDFVFVYRGTHIYGSTISKIGKMGAVVFGYNNDDPFSGNYPFYVWRLFKKAIHFYDHIFVYRQKNIDDYKHLGYEKTSILRSFYNEKRSYSLNNNLPSNKYVTDVIFLGHFENDGRDEYIKKIIDSEINFRLIGPEWEHSKYHNYFIEKLGDNYLPKFLNEDYNLALSSAKIDLVFLSKLNNDTYTRRCFEIIAAKKFMLSEYSDDLNSMFEAGKEADYFKSPQELIEKIRYYLDNEEAREKIVQAGYERLIKDGHEIKDRAREILRQAQKIKLNDEFRMTNKDF